MVWRSSTASCSVSWQFLGVSDCSISAMLRTVSSSVCFDTASTSTVVVNVLARLSTSVTSTEA